MKEQILKLRNDGKSYNEIVTELGCSKGTVSYHCGPGQKVKYRDRQRINRKNIKIIINLKLDKFLRTKVHNFKRAKTWLKTNSRLNYETAYKQIFNNPICYLTGRKIELDQPRTYHLDHVIAFSKGGSNNLNNMGLTCKEANSGKSDLSIDEFIKLCIDVCQHNGYQVVKK